MASLPKRTKTTDLVSESNETIDRENNIGLHLLKRDSPPTAESQHKKLCDFLKWCADAGFEMSEKVTVSKDGSCAQNGMIALKDIEKGETLFHVPRSALLHPDTSSIKEFFKTNEDKLQSSSGWVPLLMCLMYEYTKPSSFWRPYLDLFPCFEELDLPMFWENQDIVEELKGTGVPEVITRDLQNIQEEYKGIVLPCIEQDTKLFDPKVHTLELYKKMVAFVMAYSFTEPSKQAEDDDDNEDKDDDNDRYHPPPIMVPLADALNHIAKNNAHLRFCKESLKMVSTKPIRKGKEVYNTFGELANWQLLHMYGFSEAHPENIYDTVDVPMKFVLEQAKMQKISQIDILEKRWKYLQQLDVVAEEGSFVIGQEGILTLEELYTTLKVLTMDSETFREFKSKDGWESDEDDEESDALMNENLHNIPSRWKELLQNVLKFCLKQYKNSVEEDKDLLKQENFSKLTKRQQYALHVRIGQKQLLIKTSDLLRGPEVITGQPHPGQGDHCVLC